MSLHFSFFSVSTFIFQNKELKEGRKEKQTQVADGFFPLNSGVFFYISLQMHLSPHIQSNLQQPKDENNYAVTDPLLHLYM